MMPEHGLKAHAHTGQVKKGESGIPGRGKRRNKDRDITHPSKTLFREQSGWSPSSTSDKNNQRYPAPQQPPSAILPLCSPSGALISSISCSPVARLGFRTWETRRFPLSLWTKLSGVSMVFWQKGRLIIKQFSVLFSCMFISTESKPGVELNGSVFLSPQANVYLMIPQSRHYFQHKYLNGNCANEGENMLQCFYRQKDNI